MGRHLADTRDKIDEVVYNRIANCDEGVTYSKSYPPELFSLLKIPWGYRHDVFCALKRLEEGENISKTVVVKRAAIASGRTRLPAAREVTYVALKPPERSANRPAPIDRDAATQYA